MTATTTTRPPRGATATTTDRRRAGIALAGVTAIVSGVSVFVNGYGVGHFDDATTYTTAKNLVAATVIAAVFVAQRRHAPDRPEQHVPTVGPTRRRLTLAAIAVIGGSIPFVLFFEGLARVSSSDAAFIHKTLVVWVAVLRERLSAPHVVAIVLILGGYASVAGGVGLPVVGVGELLIVLATLCWSVEVVLARSLLGAGVPEMSVSTWRMAGGVTVLVGWAGVRGALDDLFALSPTQWGWALLTGVFLTAYVVTWHHALARAQAVVVTAMLATGAVITALLNGAVRGVAIDPIGSALLLAGGLIVAGVAATSPRPEATSP
jgi:drug/metabolite transporter (DMT)-like permease